MTEQQQEWVREAGLSSQEAFDAAVLKMEGEMLDFFEDVVCFLLNSQAFTKEIMAKH